MIGQAINETTLRVGDVVSHCKSPGSRGTIVHVDDPAYSVMVAWDVLDGEPLAGEQCFHWASKLTLEGSGT